MKKEAWAMKKTLTCEKSGLELGLAFAVNPLGNLAAERKLTSQKS
jgi:hypothetical protein